MACSVRAPPRYPAGRSPPLFGGDGVLDAASRATDGAVAAAAVLGAGHIPGSRPSSRERKSTPAPEGVQAAEGGWLPVPRPPPGEAGGHREGGRGPATAITVAG